MITRRKFVQGLGLSILGLYIRFAPTNVKAVPHVEKLKDEESRHEYANPNVRFIFDVIDCGKRSVGEFITLPDGRCSYIEYED